MEVLSPKIPTSPEILSRIPIFFPKFPSTAWDKKNPSRVGIPKSKLPLQSPFSLYLRLSSSRKFQISAHFGRPTTRRNSLRKKLNEQQQEQQQVRHNPQTDDPSPDFRNPVHHFDDINSFQSNSANHNVRENSASSDNVKGSKSKVLGESALWNKLESWVDQYKEDSEFWGIGSGPIFTVYQDSDDNVERVIVNEDEILRRSRIDPLLYKQNELEDLGGVNLKISHAKFLAKEMENGNNVIQKNSSVAKFIVSGEKWGVVNAIRGVTRQPGLLAKLSLVGVSMLCGFFVIWAVKRLFTGGEDSVEYTRLEKEMMRRKTKARMEKEKLMKGSVEIIQELREQQPMSTERPRLDKQELMDSILKVQASTDKLALPESSGTQATKSSDFDYKIQEIRAMARRARELERKDTLPDESEGENDRTVKELSNEEEVVQHLGDGDVSSPHDHPIGYAVQIGGHSRTMKPGSFDNQKGYDTGFSRDIALVETSERQTSNTQNDLEDRECSSNLPGIIEVHQPSDAPRVIRSVKAAREYLSQKRDKQEPNQETKIRIVEQVDTVLNMPNGKAMGCAPSQGIDENDEVLDASTLIGTPYFSYTTGASDDSTVDGKESVPTRISDPKVAEEGHGCSDGSKETGLSALILPRGEERDSCTNHGTSDSASTFCAGGHSTLETEASLSANSNRSKYIEERNGAVDFQSSGTSFSDESNGGSAEMVSSEQKVNWMKKNFHEFEPIVKKIQVGFKDNYMAARNKINQDLNSNTEMIQLESDENHDELEWMKDDRLREIVFQVRENELAGQDPFYMMDDEEKLAFFNGLEKKVEKENEKLSNLHEWIHSNIENLDYGADGISLYDPPEKIVPRWKGPSLENNPEFLNDFLEQRKAFMAESVRNSYLVKRDGEDFPEKSKESLSHDNIPATSAVGNQNARILHKPSKTPKTIIESSDGSVKAGKKSGKEYWQHTKKWSQGFLESYNAETDPEIKAVMKDVGKDLDRWITEKEVQEAAELMDKIPERGRKFIQEKLNKVKKEMEMFGPQAVVSKYREYSEAKEEDYLWWLDLPYVLCIELYTKENGEQKIGFYALEMAADLELDPKQYHIIAFEDAGDCKNLCYIIQAHMEMLGSGNAFVVAQTPKDAFREAKANGFSVTVIRKGELQLSVDQTLEEVEELIVEIGSKIYHDKITRERSVDIRSLMKGVFGVSKPTKRKRIKRKLKKPAKQQ
ncbi:unnamed protein product [Ilex paraguariensis]|uniref:Embryo defective 1703 n=1 Tax=Ilex paraguariensis TaxID=185542 RepID=A0ABC8QVY6_9AQUA